MRDLTESGRKDCGCAWAGDSRFFRSGDLRLTRRVNIEWQPRGAGTAELVLDF